MPRLSEQAAVRRLHDRFGFGLGGEPLTAAQTRSLAANVTALLRPTGPDRGAVGTPAPALAPTPRPAGVGGGRPDPAALRVWRRQQKRQLQAVTLWWLDRMVACDQPVAERLTWFWHGHFATSAQKVKRASLMLSQNQTLRRFGRGGFGPLAQAMITDPALLVWLDGVDNTAAAPNENLSRESLELFLLGPGRYTEDDVRAAARALTGWTVEPATGRAVLRPRRHDSSSKTILGRTGDFAAASYVDLVLDQSAAATFVVSRLWFRLVSATPPSAAARSRLRTAYGAGRDITALLTAMAAEPAFRDEASALVKQPVEWAVGLMRVLHVRPSALRAIDQQRLLVSLRGMGQVPLLPPSVGGWPAGAAWLTTAAALSRMELAQLIAGAAPLPADAARVSPKNRPEYLRRLLGLDRLTPRTAGAVRVVADQLPLAVAVLACSPEYTVSA